MLAFSATQALRIVTLVAVLTSVAEPLAAQRFGGRPSGSRPVRVKAPAATLERGPARTVATRSAPCCEAVETVLRNGEAAAFPAPGSEFHAPVMLEGSAKLGVRESKGSDVVIDVASSLSGSSARPSHKRARKVQTSR